MPSFANPDGSFSNQSDGGPVRVVSPGTVASLTVKLHPGDRSLYISNTGTTLGTLTVDMPAVSPGEHVQIGVGANVATLAVKDRLGNAITAPGSVTAGAALDMRFLDVNTGWVHWR